MSINNSMWGEILEEKHIISHDVDEFLVSKGFSTNSNTNRLSKNLNTGFSIRINKENVVWVNRQTNTSIKIPFKVTDNIEDLETFNRVMVRIMDEIKC